MNKTSKFSLSDWAPLLVLIALVIFFTVVEPRFLAVRNFARIGVSATPALMVALGVTFVIILGSIDLSMEGAVAVVAVSFALIFNALGGTLAEGGWIAIPAALALGASFGALNGLLHVRLKIPSFMSSLAMGFVGIGIAIVMSDGHRIRVEDPMFRALVTERWFDIPVVLYMVVVIVALAYFFQSKTILGRNLYAVGGAEELAHASGVHVKNLRMWVFIIAGLFYALGAIFAVGRIGLAEATSGANLMFVSITSVVVGGTALWGGRGGVLNTVIGVLTVSVINNGMIVIGLPSYIQNGVLGVLVITAVVLSTNRAQVAFVK